jgi:hypothetical protein
MRYEVRNTKKFQKFWKVSQRIASKVVDDFKDDKQRQYLVVDLTYYSTSMGDDIEAAKVARKLESDFKAKRIS